MPYSIQLLLLIASLPLKNDAESPARDSSDGELRKVIEDQRRGGPGKGQ